MLWNVKATENIDSDNPVEFFPGADGKLCCRKASKPVLSPASAARAVRNGEILRFDTMDDTLDLKHRKLFPCT